MANRYPLILDTTDGNKIKELPASDNLYLRNNNIEDVQDINALGTINAAVIRVAGEKLVAQQFTDLTDVPNSYAGSEGSFVKVKSDGTGLEFANLSDLGDVGIDNLTTTGSITVQGSIYPTVTSSYDIGSGYDGDGRKWRSIYAESFLGSLRGHDGTLVFDGNTNQIPYSVLFGSPTSLSEFTNDTGFLNSEGINLAIADALAELTVDGDITGSVFGDDSTLLVDGVNSSINLDGTVKGDIVPDADELYDIGSITSKFRDLYLSGSSIYLGDAVISASGAAINLPAGSTIDGVSIGSGSGSVDLTAFSIITGTASSNGSLSYNNTTGEFTFTPPDLTTLGVVTAESITADSLEFTGVGIVTVESGSNLVLNAANGAGNIVASGSRITNVADPIGIQDVATKAYVDSAVVGGGISFFDGDMRGSVFADDSTLLVDGVAGVLRGNVEVASTWTITTGSKTYTFYDDPEGPITRLQIPGGIVGPSQTGFTSAEGHGISIDTYNTPYSVDVGNLLGGNFIRIEDGVGLAAVIAKTYGDFTLQTNGDGGPLWHFGSGGTLNAPGIVIVNDSLVVGPALDNAPVISSLVNINNSIAMDLSILSGYTNDGSASGNIYIDILPSTTRGEIRIGDQGPVVKIGNPAQGQWVFGTDGNLTLPGNLQSQNAVEISVNLTDSTTHTWRFGEDGHLNLPSGGGNIQSDGTIQLITGSSTVSVTDDVFGFSNTKNGIIALSLISGGVSIAASGNFAFSGDNFFATTTNNINFTSGSGITLNSPVTEVRGNDLILAGNAVDIQSEGNINIDINLSDSTLRRWRFGEDGNLNLAGNLQFPNGAEIRDVNGDLRLRAAPGDVAQLQGLTTDGAVDAEVKAFHDIETGSYVTINTNVDAGAPEHVWTFDYNGDLTFPDGSVQTTAYTEPSVTTFDIDATTVSTAGLAGADTIVIAPAVGYAGSDAQSLGFTGRNVAGRRTLVINTSTLCTVDFDFGNMIGPLTVAPSTIVEVIYTGNDWFTISSNSI